MRLNNRRKQDPCAAHFNKTQNFSNSDIGSRKRLWNRNTVIDSGTGTEQPTLQHQDSQRLN